MGIFVDLTGQKFGKLTVVSVASLGSGPTKFWCRCSCGNTKAVIGQNLRRGFSKSCGCTYKGRPSHRKTHSREYRAWTGMIQRCYNPNATNFEHYGGRGITVCKRWLDGTKDKSGFTCFFEDMGPKPDGLSLDRKNNNLGYRPSNCRWATDKTQNGNRRGCVYVAFENARMTVAELARTTGVRYTTVLGRLKNGMSVQAAIKH